MGEDYVTQIQSECRLCFSNAKSSSPLLSSELSLECVHHIILFTVCYFTVIVRQQCANKCDGIRLPCGLRVLKMEQTPRFRDAALQLRNN